MSWVNVFLSPTSPTTPTCKQNQDITPVGHKKTMSDQSDQQDDSRVSGRTCRTKENTCPTMQLTENTILSDMSDTSDTKNTKSKNNPAIEYAKTLLVKCPQFGGNDLHCWYCSRCERGQTCQAIPARLKAEVKDYARYGKPYSLHLIEGTLPPEDNTLPAWGDSCPDYYQGCFNCQSYQRSGPAFCGKYGRDGRLLS